MNANKTFGSVLEANKGLGPGFDFARLFLAFSVMAWHSLLVLPEGYGDVFETPLWIFNFSILPMFFGLSGFLVAGSAQRLSLKNFALNRGLRIFPALMVEIALSAVVLGPVFTVFTLPHYFSDPLLYKYLLNMVGKINYHLPGVFLTNPFPGVVNASLWTVPFELLCYVVLGCLMFTGLIRRTGIVFVLALATIFIGFALASLHARYSDVSFFTRLDAFYSGGGAKGAPLLPCFLIGVLAYRWRDRIPCNLFLVALCLVAVALLAVYGRADFWRNWLAICAPVMVYLVCYVGLLRIPKVPFFHTGDYSYGIYLYAFPIQQSLTLLFPGLTNVWLHILISGILVTIFAAFSWHVIEKPILSLRKKFSFVARQHGIANSEPQISGAALGTPKR